jgi:hypothetical protein
MVTLDDVAEMAMSLPEVSEGTQRRGRSWVVGTKAFAWERPFSKADLKRFGDEPPPDGPILGVRVEDLMEKEAMLASGTKGFFTIPHFDGYPAFLIQLKVATKRAVREALLDAWLACAPPRLAEAYLQQQRRRSGR